MDLVERLQKAQAKPFAVTSPEEAEALVIFSESPCLSFEGESEDEPGVFIFHWTENPYDPPRVLRSDSGQWILKTEIEPNVFSPGTPVSTEYLDTNWVEPVAGMGL